MSSKKKGAVVAMFAVGDRVRVKPGTTVADFEDIPLGGWAGTVSEVDLRSDPPGYLVEWDRHTLDHMHPVFVRRCERDGLGVASMWLDEPDLGPETGGPTVIEQPTGIVTRPLNEKDQDDRVRMALGLTSDDPLPEVDGDALLAYHRGLASRLSFPIEAAWSQESGPLGGRADAVTILRLCDPEDDPWVDEMNGLLCQARAGGRVIEVALAECEAKKGGLNWQLLKDYAYWFWNNR